MKKSENQSRVIGFRVSPAEHGEISAYLQRAGMAQAEFLRNLVLSRVRGAAEFAELLPSLAVALERDVFELRKSFEQQTLLIRTLAGASIATAALMKVDDKSSPELLEQRVEETIERAIRAAPMVVDRCLEIHPELQASERS